MKKIYLASRYERKLEMREIVEQFPPGYKCCSSWLYIDDIPIAPSHRPGVCFGEIQEAAARILEEVRGCDILLLVQDDPFCYNRGGKHTEFGIALAEQKVIIVLGELENVFHYAENVVRISAIEGLIKFLEQTQKWRTTGTRKLFQAD